MISTQTGQLIIQPLQGVFQLRFEFEHDSTTRAYEMPTIRVRYNILQHPTRSLRGVMSFRVFGINFQIHSVSLTILVSIHLLIHFSTHICHHPNSRHPSLLHSFTPGSKPTFSTIPSHRRFLLPTGLPHDNGTRPDLSCSSFYF